VHTARDRRYLIVLLPIGVILALLADAIFLGTVGVPTALPGPQLGIPGEGPPPLHGVLFGPANLTPASGEVVFPVEVAPAGWWIENLSLRFTNVSGGAVTSGISATIMDGLVGLASYNLSDRLWTTGGSGTIALGDSLVLSSTDFASLPGGTLSVVQGSATVGYPVPYPG
jgi:hypothetical protein